MRVHWVWVAVGFAGGAILWPKIAPKLGSAKKMG